MARGNGYTLFLTANDAVFSLYSRSAEGEPSTVRRAPELRAKSIPGQRHAQKDSAAVVRMQLAGGNSLAKVSASGQLPGKSNYFLGNDPSKWRADVPHYARVSYQYVYPGVNMAFHGAQRQLEFDFVVAPGANPAPIGFHFTGAQGIKTDDSGNLVISSTADDVLLRKPVAYQEQNGARQAVDARFVLKAGNQVSFELGNYDRSRELVIDPSVSYAYSTYLGGTADDKGFGIAFDSSGNAYVTGETASTNFPGASNSLAGGTDVFVTKIKPDGSGLVYSTYVGGSLNDSGNAIAVDQASGVAFVAGGTSSIDFPKTAGAFQTALGSGAASNAFVFELDPTGSTLTYCTYLGGTVNDVAFGIALDNSGNAYAGGLTSSTDFPTKNPLQTYPGGTHNGFVTKLNPSGNALVFSTYLGLGGATSDSVNAVALDPSDNVYVTGTASGAGLHTTTGAFQITNGGLSDAFVTVINAAGTGYVYSTFLGGSGNDVGNGIAVDSLGNAYITGLTESANFPLQSPLPGQGAFGGGASNAFVTKLNPTGTAPLVYSTYLGGSQADFGASIAVDGSNNAYVTGQTNSPNFPTMGATQSALKGGIDAFVSEINSTGSALAFSTYLGGSLDEDVGGSFGAIAVDSAGANIYVTGNTVSTDFPTHGTPPYTGGNANGGLADAFVVKYTQSSAAQTFSLAATALSPTSVSPGGSSTSTVTVTSATGFSGSVTITCAVSPAPALAPTCGAASATAAAPATLTVSTTPVTALLRHPANGRSSGLFYAMFLPVGGMALLGLGFGSAGSRRKKLFGCLLLGLLLSGLILMPACGGSSGGGGGGHGSPGTPAGTYTITVSGTASGATQTGTSPSLTLIVN